MTLHGKGFLTLRAGWGWVHQGVDWLEEDPGAFEQCLTVSSALGGGLNYGFQFSTSRGSSEC